MIRLGQLLKFAGVVSDGGEAKGLLADGAVLVDGELETRRGRQVPVGSVVEIDLGRRVVSIRVIQKAP